MTNINNQQILSFVNDKYGATINRKEAQELGITNEYADYVEEVNDDEVNVEVLIEDKDIAALFMSMQAEEEKEQTAKNEEEENLENRKVQEKGNASN